MHQTHARHDQEQGPDYDARRFLTRPALQQGKADSGQRDGQRQASPSEQQARDVAQEPADGTGEVGVDTERRDDSDREEQQAPHVVGLPAQMGGQRRAGAGDRGGLL